MATIGVMSLLLATGGTASASPGAPGEGAVRIALEGGEPWVADTRYCGFEILVEPVEFKEYIIHDTVLADGTDIQRITGRIVARFTNTSTGTSIVRNLSGPGTYTSYPDGGSQEDMQGLQYGFLGPLSQAKWHLPGLFFTSGHTVVQRGPVGPATLISITGKLTDGCALLA